MNCAYHIGNQAVVNCHGCGKYLCPACDHRIKGFPYCQDCIVMGVELLQRQGYSQAVPLAKKQSSPFLATFFSLICILRQLRRLGGSDHLGLEAYRSRSHPNPTNFYLSSPAFKLMASRSLR